MKAAFILLSLGTSALAAVVERRGDGYGYGGGSGWPQYVTKTTEVDVTYVSLAARELFRMRTDT